MTPHDYALIAQEAYTASPDIGAADSASRAIFRYTPDGLCVAFPGTDNFASWMADLDVLTVSVPGAGEIHRGFWEAWGVIAPKIVPLVGDQPVTFVGHSLGAALAICAAVELTVSGHKGVSVYGFEPPRVSPATGVRTLLVGVPIYLTRNGHDVVPDVPLDWQHAADLTPIGKAIYPFPNVADHMLANIIAALS